MNYSAQRRQTSQPGMEQQPQLDSAGSRRWQRDNQRQQNYVLDQDWRANRDWNNQAQIEQDFQSRQQQPDQSRQRRNRQRAQNWKGKKQPVAEVPAPQVQRRMGGEGSRFRSSQDSGERDEPLYELVSGSRPVRKIYSHNLDFSSFPLLCETVHRELKQTNPRLKREMPFCAFLHAMTSCLNAWLFRTVTDLNSEDRYSDEKDALALIPQEMLIPQPIAEFLSMVNTVVTPSGDTVRVNIPDIALPQHSLPDVAPGSFGVCDQDTHNAYECYVSPLITRNFLIASRDNQHDYEPLPPALAPANMTPTRNLLGYYPAEQLTPEGRAVLGNYDFPDSDDMAGRLQIIPALLQETSNVLFRCSREFKMSKFHDIQRKPVQTSLVFSKTLAVTGNANSSELSRTVSNVHGPYAFGNVTSTQAVLFALRRERTPHARGLCYVSANGAAPAGWTATTNRNFEMQAEFMPLTGVDGPQFRADSHQAFPPDGTRESFLADWLKAFRLQKTY